MPHRSTESPNTSVDWFTVTTPLTPLAVAMRGRTVVGIRLGAVGDREPRSSPEHRVADELRAYTRGDRQDFSFPIEPSGTAFDHEVWNAVARIPYGQTSTYGAIAHSIGAPRAARAVGHANGRNPIPIVIPCHRVVAAGGKLGGYGGGLPLKRRLLALEERVRGLRPALGALLLAGSVLAAAACGDPERPTFEPFLPGADTTGPVIEFLPANADSVFPRGTLIIAQLRITDRHLIREVSAGVQGIVNFGFPTEFPDDTTFSVEYRIQPPEAVVGLILFSISATDELDHRSSTTRTFRLE